MHHAESQLFQYTIDLSVQKNRKSKPKTQRAREPKPQKSHPKPRAAKQPKPKRDKTPVTQKAPMSPEERLQHKREYEKTRGKSPERKEKRRGYIQTKRQEAKSLGLCVTCWAPTIPDQTRCKPCAEEHQKYHKEAKERAIQQRIQASGQATFL